MDAKFCMPPVEIGQDVLWYAGGDRRNGPIAAKVVEIGPDGIAVCLFRSHCSQLDPRTGVRHLDDPVWQADPQPECCKFGGGWDYLKSKQPLVNYRITHKKEEELVSTFGPASNNAEASVESIEYSGEELREQHRQVLRLHLEKGLYHSVIASRLKHRGWTTAKVKEYLDQFTTPEAAKAELARLSKPETANA